MGRYDATPDPYCYAGTTVLKNILGLRDSRRLIDFETVSVAQRSEEPLPSGSLGDRHFKAVHRHLFQDVYRWAGRVRTVRLSKAGSPFCYPEHIEAELRQVFQWLKAENHLQHRSADAFAEGAAHFLAGLNAIHAFREGNGRAQLSFMALLANGAGHPLDLQRLAPDAFLSAMIRSFHGDEPPLAAELRRLIV